MRALGGPTGQRGRRMRLIKRLLLGTVIVVGLLAIGGASYQWLAERADNERFPAPGELVDVDGLQMHIDCRGAGRPLVILEAGLTTGSWSWGTVFDAIAGHTEVCAYDRPGMGWSEPLNRIADAGEVADRLHALIGAVGLEGPYVLVGMSAGGVYVREYYQRYPDGVEGMVLVDSSHEQQDERLPAFEGEAGIERMVRICSYLQPFGVVRLTDGMAVMFDQRPEIPPQTRALLRSRVEQSHYCTAMLAESRSFEGEVHDAEPPRSLGDLPLTVLSQGNEPQGNEMFGVSDEQARQQRAVWDELQKELTALSSRGKRRVAGNSGHIIQLEQPALMIDAVVQMVEDLRRADR